MPRQPRIEYEGALYHVMARGDQREDIFFDDKDRTMFLKTLAEACARTGWRCHAYVLMSNHYHLVIETPKANLVAGMSWLQNAFTRRHNVRHKRWGHLFGGRYKAILVDDEEGWYLGTLIDYVHLNPVRAGLASLDSGLESYGWSSLAAGYVVPAGKRQSWLCVERGLRVWRFKDNARGRRGYLEHLEEKVRQEGAEAGRLLPANQSVQSTLKRGWFFGAQAFREKALALGENALEGTATKRNYGASAGVKDHHLRMAMRLVDAGMKECKLTEEDLVRLAHGDERKAMIALAIKTHTTVPLDWVAERLHMGTRSTVSRTAALVKRKVERDGKLSKVLKKIERVVKP
ncbi:MAG: transposase [Verrucomicrobiaceae bacterium]|nr:transposase [Verrucomicrobiaceae bacterium]